MNLIELAVREIDTVESPTNSHKTKYGRWFGCDTISWQGIFVSWCYYMAGYQLPSIGFLKGFAGCQFALEYFKNQGYITITPEAGDIVFFSFNNDGRYDHCGIFEEDIDGIFFNCIEGNTSDDNQTNGGKVMRKQRAYRDAVFVILIKNKK